MSIQKLTEPSDKDFEEISRVLYSCFTPKFGHVGLSEVNAIQYLNASLRDSFMAHHYHFAVYRTDSNVIKGVCHLSLPVDSSIKKPKSNLEQYLEMVNLRKRWRISKLFLLSDDIKLEPLESYIKALAVDPSLQGQGVGRKLLQWADDFSLESGCKKISLHVACSNRARNLYERFEYLVDNKKSAVNWLEYIYCMFMLGEPGFWYMTKSLADPRLLRNNK